MYEARLRAMLGQLPLGDETAVAASSCRTVHPVSVSTQVIEVSIPGGASISPGQNCRQGVSLTGLPYPPE